MNEEFYQNNEDYLAHYGVKGMKWGIRKAARKDVKAARKMRRGIAADKKMLKQYGKSVDAAESNYKDAENDYKKSISKIAIGRRARERRNEQIEDASSNLSKAGKQLSKDKANLLRAERIYDVDAKKLTEHVDKMMSKYGSENIKSLKNKKINIGEHYTKEVIKTGITIADLPLVGNIYTSHVYSPKEFNERRTLIDEESNKRY